MYIHIYIYACYINTAPYNNHTSLFVSFDTLATPILEKSKASLVMFCHDCAICFGVQKEEILLVALCGVWAMFFFLNLYGYHFFPKTSPISSIKGTSGVTHRLAESPRHFYVRNLEVDVTRCGGVSSFQIWAHFAGHKMQLARRWHVWDGSPKKLGNMVNPPCFDPFTGNCFDRFRFSVSFRFNVKLPDSEFVKIQYQPGQLAPGPDAWILDEFDMRGRYISW